MTWHIAQREGKEEDREGTGEEIEGEREMRETDVNINSMSDEEDGRWRAEL
jgi:hypothetical protein